AASSFLSLSLSLFSSDADVVPAGEDDFTSSSVSTLAAFFSLVCFDRSPSEGSSCCCCASAGAATSATRTKAIKYRYRLISNLLLVHDLARRQDLGRLDDRFLQQRASVVIDDGAATEDVIHQRFFAGEDGAEQVRLVGAAAGELHHAAHQDEPVELQAAVDVQVAIDDQDTVALRGGGDLQVPGDIGDLRLLLRLRRSRRKVGIGRVRP